MLRAALTTATLGLLFTAAPWVAQPAGATAGPCGSDGVFDAAGPSCTYTTPEADTFTVPFAVTHVHVDALGAQGGQGSTALDTGQQAAPGGLGGEAAGTVQVASGQVLQVNVGGRGTAPANDFNGGFNGGGGGAGAFVGGNLIGGGGGGGASDVRTGSCAATRSCGTGHRVLVGGGGGGTGEGDNSPAGDGGGGAATDAQVSGGSPCPFYCGGGGLGGVHGGTGGVAGFEGSAGGDQSDGTGGDGAYPTGGGGGGGHVGGGGGGSGQEYGGGGGGGSNFADAALTATSFDTGVRHGNGKIVISWTMPAVADLAVSVTGPASATAGAQASFSVTATNIGDSAAQGVTLTDATPAGSTFVAETQTSGPALSCTNPAAGQVGTTSCTLGSLASGASATIRLTYAVPADAPAGTVVDSAHVEASTPDPDPSNNTDSATVPLTGSADLSIVLNGPASASPGATVTYEATIANAGPSAAQGVTLTAPTPAGATFVSQTQPSGTPLSCSDPAVGQSGTTTCSVAVLPAGSGASIELSYAIAPGSSLAALTGQADVAAATPDPNPADNAASLTTQLTASADLAVTVSGPALATAGSTATYVVQVSNSGPSDAAGVSVTDAVPAGATFVAQNQDSGPAFSCTNPPAGQPGTTTCSVAALPAGASASFGLTYRVDGSTSTPLTDTANVSAATADPDPADNSASVTTPVQVPTALVVYPSILQLLPGPGLTLTLSATLTTASGTPLPNETIAFSAGATPICSATTDATGTARCGGVGAVVQSVLSLGYDAVFAGRAPYLPSSGHGSLVKIGGLRLG